MLVDKIIELNKRGVTVNFSIEGFDFYVQCEHSEYGLPDNYKTGHFGIDGEETKEKLEKVVNTHLNDILEYCINRGFERKEFY